MAQQAGWRLRDGVVRWGRGQDPKVTQHWHGQAEPAGRDRVCPTRRARRCTQKRLRAGEGDPVAGQRISTRCRWRTAGKRLSGTLRKHLAR